MQNLEGKRGILRNIWNLNNSNVPSWLHIPLSQDTSTGEVEHLRRISLTVSPVGLNIEVGAFQWHRT
ncbi:hypothetical protein [Desulfosporosinus acidiphilus]|uniref:hypothetical protein n=1 Tax=Desulfosporosinus acidiphilus TaxID=885581 RepID=UPI0011D206DD|nr:hypothetical protein [Desulfosporosinus acidiphilus]